MNTQNSIEKIFLKKKNKNLPDPGANSQVYILNLSHGFATVTVYFVVGINHSVKGVLQGSAAMHARHIVSERRAMYGQRDAPPCKKKVVTPLCVYFRLQIVRDMGDSNSANKRDGSTNKPAYNFTIHTEEVQALGTRFKVQLSLLPRPSWLGQLHRAAVPSDLNGRPHTRVAKPRGPFPTCFAVLLMNYS